MGKLLLLAATGAPAAPDISPSPVFDATLFDRGGGARRECKKGDGASEGSASQNRIHTGSAVLTRTILSKGQSDVTGI